MIVELNESEYRVLKKVLDEAIAKEQAVTFEFNKNSLEEIGYKNAKDLSSALWGLGEVYWDDNFYKVYVENIPINSAKEWFESEYDVEAWDYALSRIFIPSNGKHEQIDIMNGSSKPPQWDLANTSKAKGTERWVVLAYNRKGLKYETVRNLMRTFENFEGRDTTYHEDDPYISATFPMVGLKNIIAKINALYPKLASRLRVFSDYNMTKDITAKYVKGA